MSISIPKQARIGSNLDYEFDWAGESPGPWLDAGETITAYEVRITGPLTLGQSINDDGKIKVWVAVKTDARVLSTGRITCQITTSAGRVDSRSFVITVVN